MTFPMAAFLSISVGESWSRGFGNSVIGTQGAAVFDDIFVNSNCCLLFLSAQVAIVDYKFFIEKTVIIPKIRMFKGNNL
jgi:hypothetical protein